MKTGVLVTLIGALIASVPQQYMVYVASGLGVAYSIVHLMTEWQPTNGLWAQIATVLNGIAGNTGKAANVDPFPLYTFTPPEVGNSGAGPSATLKSLALLCVLIGVAATLSACKALSSAAAVVSTASTDSISTLDAGVKSLTLVDQGLTIYVRLPLCAPGTTFVAKAPCSNAAVAAKVQADAHAARLKLEAAQADATQASAALSALAAVSAEFATL
jgi:hypothetical protein